MLGLNKKSKIEQLTFSLYIFKEAVIFLWLTKILNSSETIRTQNLFTNEVNWIGLYKIANTFKLHYKNYSFYLHLIHCTQ